MARRKQFTQLISDLRAELERSSDPAVGVSDLPALKQAITRNYETLYDAYDWPHLNQVFDRITLNAGQRYYDFPENMDYDNLKRVVVWWNSRPVPIHRGISFEEYAVYSSEDDERVDPVVKWDVRATDTVEQCEVWPVPASSGQYLQFEGKLKFVQLVDDDDLCRLDDHLVVLYSAADLLGPKSGKVQLKITEAQQRLGMLKAKSASGSGTVRMGLGAADKGPSYGRSVVRVSG